MSKNNELAVQETQEMALSTQQDFTMDDMMEELDGLGSINFEKIKIPSGGGIAFEVPTDNPEEPESKTSIDGVIVLHQPCNVYFRNKFGETDEKAPDCSSPDGKTGYMRDSGTEKTCATCKFNQFGSGDGGTGKACQNRIDLYILMEGNDFPVVLSLPATSIKAFKTYLTTLVLHKQPMRRVKTKITLKKAKSSGGITYSTCVFKKLGAVEPEEMENIEQLRDLCKAMAQRSYTVAAEDDGESTSDVELTEETGEDKDLPF